MRIPVRPRSAPASAWPSSWTIVTHTPVTRQIPPGTTSTPAMTAAAATIAHSSCPASRSSRPTPRPSRPSVMPSPPLTVSAPRVARAASPHTLPAAGEGTLSGTVDLDVLDHAAPDLALDLVEQPVPEDLQLRRPGRRRGPHDERGRVEPLDDAVRRDVPSHEFGPPARHLRDVEARLPPPLARELREEPGQGPGVPGVRPGARVRDPAGTSVRGVRPAVGPRARAPPGPRARPRLDVRHAADPVERIERGARQRGAGPIDGAEAPAGVRALDGRRCRHPRLTRAAHRGLATEIG